MICETRYALAHTSYDGVMSALTGNGELCTTLGPTGYHTADMGERDAAHATQRFVMAGRRLSGPQHPLVDFGTLTRDLYVDGTLSWAECWQQHIDWSRGVICSRLSHQRLTEEVISCVALHANQFLARTCITNIASEVLSVAFLARYSFAYSTCITRSCSNLEEGTLDFSVEGHLGSVQLVAALEGCSGAVNVRGEGADLLAEIRLNLGPGETARICTGLRFADRMHYSFPMQPADITASLDRHTAEWASFWSTCRVETGDSRVDDFRRSALYTIRCQATPWSVPPTLSERYWGGGAFHDELYPFLGLLTSCHLALAERIPYFRLTTLPRAVQRARGRGALYPWSSTEDGEERDPNGLWLTERFHMGQFALCVRHLWRYTGARDVLEDLYPVVREIARFYELELLVEDASGSLHTKPCVDFDESVGAVRDGPFTVCAATAALQIAAEAAEVLGRDTERAARWRLLADRLWQSLPEAPHPDGTHNTVAIPDGQPFHYSVLGPIFPFELETGSERARATARLAASICRTEAGWQPGLSEVFRGSTWMWQAGHFAAVYALLREGSAAWSALLDGVAAAGAFLAPNEHVDCHGRIQVPWFTTGCGAWLYALNALFVQVDAEGTVLFPAVPNQAGNAIIHRLAAGGGARVSATLEAGRVQTLSASAPAPMTWQYRIHRKVVPSAQLRGEVRPIGEGWLQVSNVRLETTEQSLLLTEGPTPSPAE